jgi:hypothetical protein
LRGATIAAGRRNATEGVPYSERNAKEGVPASERNATERSLQVDGQNADEGVPYRIGIAP